MSSLNLVHAARTLSRRPGFVALASLTLGLGIAANLALFSLLDAVYFRRRLRDTVSRAFVAKLIREACERERDELRGDTGLALHHVERQRLEIASGASALRLGNHEIERERNLRAVR